MEKNMNKQTINGAFRKKKVYFSQVSNVAIRDNALSLKAKGLYALIQSYITIEDFVLYKSTLKNQCIEGDKSFEGTWKELKDAGYLIQYRSQKENGHYYYEYELLDVPDKELADEIHSQQNRKKQEDKTHNPKKVGMDKTLENQCLIHNPKMDVMEKGYGGEVGIYNNTDLNNTDLNNTKSLSQDTERGNKQLIEEGTTLKLSPSQSKTVSTWDQKQLELAIQLFINHSGNSFAYLKNCYTNPVHSSSAKATNVQLTSKNTQFTTTYSHNWDLDQLDDLAQEYLERNVYRDK